MAPAHHPRLEAITFFLNTPAPRLTMSSATLTTPDPEKGYSPSSSPSSAPYDDTKYLNPPPNPTAHPHHPYDGALALAAASAASAPPDLDPAPDGGFWAWTTVAGAYLAVFVQFGLINTFGVFQSYYEQHQLKNYTSSEIAWIGSVQQLILFFVGLFVGRVFDAHGAHVLLIPGSFILVFSLMMTSCECSPLFLLPSLAPSLLSLFIIPPGVSPHQAPSASPRPGSFRRPMATSSSDVPVGIERPERSRSESERSRRGFIEGSER